MKYCNDCEMIVEEGSTEETVSGEYWGAQFTQTNEYECCSICGSEDIEDVEKCPCQEIEVEPLHKNKWGLCENCRDNLEYELSEIRKIFGKKVLAGDKSTVETYILENLWRQ